MHDTIGDLIRGWRREAGMTQEALAGLMHCSQRSIARLEGAGDRVRLSVLMKAAMALGRNVQITIEEASNDENAKAG